MSLHSRKAGWGWTTLLAAALILVWTWGAQAAPNKYSLSGNSRAQIGDGLPLPITFVGPPNGAVKIPAGAYVFQGQGADPKPMTLVPATQPLFFNTNKVIGVHVNPNVFQVRTSLSVRGPWAATGTAMVGTAMFSAGGRTGPAVFSWCPGLPLPTGTVNPGCASTGQTGVTLPLRVRYQAVSNQFGGVSQGKIAGVGTKGGASVVLDVGFKVANQPCVHPYFGGIDAGCVGLFSPIAVDSRAVGGGPVGFVATDVPPLGKLHPVSAAGNGIILQVGPFAGYGPGNTVVSYGFPWTTGKVTVSAPKAKGAPELFYLSGMDNRVDGLGTISLVTGGISARGLSGDNANRGWLNYTINGGAPIPSISTSGLLMLSTIILGMTVWMIRRATAAAA